MSGLIGKKIGMTSLFDTDGSLVACTVIEASPNVVSHVKTMEKDGYAAVQLSAIERRVKSTPAASIGHYKKANTTPKVKAHEFVDLMVISIVAAWAAQALSAAPAAMRAS